MSVTTIKIPDGQVEAVRESLRARRNDLAEEAGAPSDRLAELDALLCQVDQESASGSRELTGSPAVLWAAVYDSLCVAAERLAADCNELWRGEADASDARAQAVTVNVWLDLLDALGANPVPVTDA